MKHVKQSQLCLKLLERRKEEFLKSSAQAFLMACKTFTQN